MMKHCTSPLNWEMDISFGSYHSIYQRKNIRVSDGHQLSTCPLVLKFFNSNQTNASAGKTLKVDCNELDQYACDGSIYYCAMNFALRLSRYLERATS
ncbi:hypothetical protein VCR4J5_1510102 [Vibrio crassostreae]|uniref:Uncharacterized protein n=1 Tax=Vibrio crassostreae TaxID=246167 RepID=A0ABM9QPL3_9VIBR|nr:hypothetical protein VCR4J5_1510102 [Vibrio crassostreae]